MKVAGAGMANRGRVLAALIPRPASRTDLAEQTGLSKPTVSRVVESLLSEGLVREKEAVPKNPVGRYVVPLEFSSDRGVVCGVDLGATTTRFLLSDLGGRPRAIDRRPTSRRNGGKALSRWLFTRVEELRERAGETELWGLAVGVPGVVHPETEEIRCAPNLPSIEGRAFASGLRSHLSHVAIDNDANFALLGELYFGSARGFRSGVMFTIGTGVGAAAAVDGALYRGRTGFAGEFGYMLTGSDSKTLEDAISGAGLLKAAADLGLDISSTEEIFAADADPGVQELRLEAEHSLLTALTAVTAAYEPEVIVLGGGVSASLDPWLPKLAADLRELVPSASPVVISELSDLAGALGALVAALNQAYARIGVSLADLDGAPGAVRSDEVIEWLERATADVS